MTPSKGNTWIPLKHETFPQAYKGLKLRIEGGEVYEGFYSPTFLKFILIWRNQFKGMARSEEIIGYQFLKK